MALGATYGSIKLTKLNWNGKSEKSIEIREMLFHFLIICAFFQTKINLKCKGIYISSPCVLILWQNENDKEKIVCFYKKMFCFYIFKIMSANYETILKCNCKFENVIEKREMLFHFQVISAFFQTKINLKCKSIYISSLPVLILWQNEKAIANHIAFSFSNCTLHNDWQNANGS